MRVSVGTSAEDAPPIWFGAIFIIVGATITAVGAGWIATDPASIHAPRWVLQMVGLFFALAGTMFYTQQLHENVNRVLGIAFLSAFGSVQLDRVRTRPASLRGWRLGGLG